MTKLLDEIMITAEVTGTSLSKAGAMAFVRALQRYPEQQVIASLHRCQVECKYKLTIADIVSRLDDGRPGVEEAWAQCPWSEADTVVWTAEMSSAFYAALPLLEQGDAVAARMAFKQKYEREISQARADGKQPTWTIALGHDKAGREDVVREAVRAGKITSSKAVATLPHMSFDESTINQLQLDKLNTLVKALTDKRTEESKNGGM